jgi:hypothetical protein
MEILIGWWMTAAMGDQQDGGGTEIRHGVIKIRHSAIIANVIK